jgi:hypothetical protein
MGFVNRPITPEAMKLVQAYLGSYPGRECYIVRCGDGVYVQVHVNAGFMTVHGYLVK